MFVIHKHIELTSTRIPVVHPSEPLATRAVVRECKSESKRRITSNVPESDASVAVLEAEFVGTKLLDAFGTTVEFGTKPEICIGKHYETSAFESLKSDFD